MSFTTQYQYPSEAAAAAGTTGHVPPSVNAADASMFDLQLVMGNQLDDGDVLVVINLGDDGKDARACDGHRWQSMRIRMKSEKLLNLGSSKITNMFSPQRQERTRRRLRLDILPPGVQYVLDLTPPSEGSELADLTAALWLPRMVKLWFLAGYFVPDSLLTKDDTGLSSRRPLGDKAVGAIMVLGHDDACKSESCKLLCQTCPEPPRLTITGLVDIAQWEVDTTVTGIYEDDSHLPPWRRVDDYCPIRHRAAIMRLLRFINGHGLLLNSAIRMWTVAQVAIHLEVPRLVQDPVTQWLIAPPNSKFIEICPEKAFQLAYALQIPSVLVASFRILVNELAIDYAACFPSPRPPTHTWVQRRRDDYGDFPSDPVQYASRAFADRIQNTLAILRSDSVLDTLETRGEEWDRLRSMGPQINALPHDHPLRKTYTTLVEALVATFHRTIADALDTPIPLLTKDVIEAQRQHYLPRGHQPIAVLYNSLNDHQKAMTPFFWNHLKNSFNFRSLQESTHKGVQLWRIVQNFIFQARSAGDDWYTSPDSWEFNLRAHSEQLYFAVLPLCDRMTNRRDIDSNIVYFLSDHLTLSLEETEFEFLPIWAGGLDDGSGGVFQEIVPSTDMGPSEPGPAYHTGHTIQAPTDASTATMTDAASTIGPSDLGIGDLDIYTDAGVRSIDANQSVTTAPPRGRVVAMSDDVASERFSIDDDDFADARFEEPAGHQAVGQAILRYADDEMEAEGSTADTADDGNSVAWSYVGSTVVSAVEPPVPPEQARSAAPSTATAAPSGTNESSEPALDCFGLEGEGEGDFDFDDDDDDGTSTLDGSDFDMI